MLLILFAKLAVHLYAGRRYGFFVDELYYLACSHHLDWGYVDQPPLIAAIAWLVRELLGQSLPAIRLLPALAGIGEIALTVLIARELGARRFGQSLAALCVLAAPDILASDNLFTMNAFEPLFWMGCAWLLIRIIKTGNGRLWIWFGIVAGLGLENKHSMLIFGAGVVVGLLLTQQRRWLASRWLLAPPSPCWFSCLTCCGISGIISRFWNCRPTSGAAGGIQRSVRSRSSFRKPSP